MDGWIGRKIDSQCVRLLTAKSSCIQTPGLGRRLAGASCVDYFVTDRFVTDPVEARSFAESLVVLPHSYQPQDELQNDVAYAFGLVTRSRLQLHRVLLTFHQALQSLHHLQNLLQHHQDMCILHQQLHVRLDHDLHLHIQ